MLDLVEGERGKWGLLVANLLPSIVLISQIFKASELLHNTALEELTALPQSLHPAGFLPRIDWGLSYGLKFGVRFGVSFE